MDSIETTALKFKYLYPLNHADKILATLLSNTRQKYPYY